MNEPDSDEALAKLAKAGDKRAFDAIIHRYKDPLHRLVRRYVGNSDDAYDILQQTFLAAWMSLNRYDTNRPLLPWLRTIALNKCRDYSRRLSVRRMFLTLFASQTATEAMPTASDAEEDRLNQLDQAIAALPPFYKEPLLLTAVSGLSHQEAADTLKTTAKAIEMRLRRARQQLAKALSPREG